MVSMAIIAGMVAMEGPLAMILGLCTTIGLSLGLTLHHLGNGFLWSQIPPYLVPIELQPNALLFVLNLSLRKLKVTMCKDN